MVRLRRRNPVADTENALRDSLWPEAEERRWRHIDHKGFVTIPKTMPFICRLLDELSKNFPLSTTYQALWTYTWDTNGFIKLSRPKELAFAARFSGQRAEHTLYDRITRLNALGLVEVKPSGANRFGFIFLPNPHTELFRLRKASAARLAEMGFSPATGVFQETTFNAFLERALEVFSDDVKELVANEQKRSAPIPKVQPPKDTPTRRLGRRRRRKGVESLA